jgi:serine phosphatase RsbU (regulator of sigma subunit)
MLRCARRTTSAVVTAPSTRTPSPGAPQNAFRDELTGTLTWRAGRQQLRTAVEYAHRTRTVLAVVVVDVDGGDDVLVAAGSSLRATLRADDLVMRHDVHAFVCALPGNTNATAALCIARAARALAATMPGATLDAASALALPGDTLEDLVDRAGADLFRLPAAPQQRLRPAAPPADLSRIDDLSVASRCIPAGPGGLPAGGDFVDAFRLDAERVLVAVGDVAGHGVGASARMWQLRAATRAFALHQSSPVEVLRRLDRMQALHDPEDIATLWLGIYDPGTGLLRYASAGHPPPVVAGHGGRPVLLDEATAPPLGTGVVADLAPVHEIVLPVGAVLVAYSDGLVERPDRDLDEQLHLLRALVEETYAPGLPGASLSSFVDAIFATLVPDAAATHDDVCVLVLRREPT